MSSSISSTISGGVSFAGLGSGTDFSALVSSLLSVESIYLTRLELWESEWEYRSTALEEVITAMSDAKTALSAFTTTGSILSATASSSDDTVATATVDYDSDLISGNYSLNVEQVATASFFCSQDMFSSGSDVINTTGESQEFTYVYQGVTRSLTIAAGCTLDQLLLQINNDAENPGVSASLIKNGNSYMFQLQGDDTGAENELYVTSTLDAFEASYSLYTAEDVSINDTGETQAYTMYYNGSTIEIDITAGMTAGEFVDAFNDASSSLTASLERDGSDYIITYKNSSGYEVSVPVDCDLEAFGGGSGFESADAVINNTSTVQTYTYTYMDSSYTVQVADGTTLQGLVDKINSASNNPGVTAYLEEDPETGLFNIAFTKEDMILNDTGATQELVFSYQGGQEFAFDIEAGTTLKEYVDMFNTASTSLGLSTTASLVTDDDGNTTVKYVMNSEDITADISFSFDSSDADSMQSVISGTSSTTLETMEHSFGSYSNLEGLGAYTTISGKDTVVAETESSISFEYDGKTYSATIDAGSTLDSYVTQFNEQNTDVQAEIISGASGYYIQYTDADGNAIDVENVQSDAATLAVSGDNWYTQEAKDAIFYVNGWEIPVTSSSNTLSEVIEGLTMTIKSTGETNFSITTDSSALIENIYTIIDTMNTIKGTILALTEVDSEKDVNSPADSDLSSQMTWQYGSALTGNYGVQLLLSNYNSLVTSTAIGFTAKYSTEDPLNDLYTTLSQLGIYTDTDTSSDTYGLLVVNETDLQAAIDEDIEAVANLFSMATTGTSDSTAFSVASTGTYATAGTYDVTYSVSDDGTVDEVYINGVLALTDPDYPGRYTCGDYSNDCAGVALQFMTGGLTPGEYTEEIDLKQGKVNELINFLSDELTTAAVDGDEQGTLPTIVSNYADIMESIQDKIDSETTRLAAWEATMTAKFARLDVVLAEYNTLLSTINSMMSSTTSY